jgi:hypothetical protein
MEEFHIRKDQPGTQLISGIEIRIRGGGSKRRGS